jgi:hypothetical protein
VSWNSGLTLALVFCSGVLAAPSNSPQEALLSIHLFDKPYAVEAELRERTDPRDGHLFADLPEGTKLHPSYDATYEFCQRFNAYNKSDSEVSDAEIDAYLAVVIDMDPIQEAFRITGKSSIEDLRKAWFRGGRGFEHVICGEGGSGMKLGGYHFWYLQYRYERDGRAEYQGADYGSDPISVGIADKLIATGKMSFDPDGDAGRPPLVKKPRGGFTVNHSVGAMLAAGLIAVHGKTSDFLWNREGEFGLFTVLQANLNGKTYPWTFHKDQGSNSVRTLWPRFVPGMFVGAQP